jgi:hypothetical protein
MIHIAFIRVPKTASSYMMMKLRVYRRDTDAVLCGGHLRVSDIPCRDDSHVWMTMMRDPYQVSLSLFYMLRRMAATPDFDKIQAERVAKDPERKNRFVHTPHYQHHLALARHPDTTPDIWLDQSIPNHSFGYHFDVMTPDQFDFVGNVNDMQRTEELLVKVFPDWPLVLVHDGNVNPDKPVGFPYPEGEFTEAMFRRRNAVEYQIYDLGMQRFNQLCQQHGI